MEQSLTLSAVRRQEPSHHRKLMLKVANSLSKEEVADIVYLSEDFVPVDEVAKISSGIDLMRCLERHGRLRPGGYHYLLSCLREVGRIDVANTLSESLQTPLLNLPPGFSVSSQMYQLKLGVLERKQTNYSQHMKHLSELSHNKPFWESEWKEIFGVLCEDFVRSDKKGLPGQSEVDWVFATGLEDVTAGSQALIAGLKSLKGVSDISTAAGHFSEVYERFEKLSKILESIDWRKNCCGRFMADIHLASKACAFLGEFLAELLGETKIYTEAQALSKGLHTMSTIVNIAQCGLRMLQWFFTATDVVIASSLDIHKYKSQLSNIISFLVQEDMHIHNSQLYKEVLKGTGIATIRATAGACSATQPVTVEGLPCPPTSIIPFCPVLVTLYLNSYVLIHIDQLGPGDWGRIKANYQLAEARFAQMYSVGAGGLFRVLRSLVGSFEQSILSAALEQTTGLQTLITEVLKHGNASHNQDKLN